MREPVTTMVCSSFALVLLGGVVVPVSCAMALPTTPAVATAPSVSAKRTADESLFVSRFIKLSNVGGVTCVGT